MRTKTTISEQREKAKTMRAWETDEDGQYARGRTVVDPIVCLGIVPVFGLSVVMGSVMAAYGMDGATGIKQKAVRTAHVSIAGQAVWIFSLLLLLQLL